MFHLAHCPIDHNIARQQQTRSTRSPGVIQGDESVQVLLVELSLGATEGFTEGSFTETVLDDFAGEREGERLGEEGQVGRRWDCGPEAVLGRICECCVTASHFS